MPAFIRIFGTAWGIGGIAAVLLYGSARLSRYTLEAIDNGLTAPVWLLLGVNIIFMAWAEGYRGFQRHFSPRVAARALHLYRQPTLLRIALAPLFCAGFFGATPRLIRLTWIGAALILFAIALIRSLDQPWRGILDAGVVVGLLWGAASLTASAWRTFRGHRELIDAEVSGDGGL